MAASVTAVLIAGLVVSLLAFAKARHERDRALLAEQRAAANEQKARSEAARSTQVAQFMKDMLLGVGPSVALGRDTTMLKEILDKTAERLGKELMNHPEVEADLRNTIGFVYWELGEHEKAYSMYRQSLELMRKVWGNEHAAVADTLHNCAELLRRAGESGAGERAEAELMERQALAIREKLFGREHPAVGASLNTLGFMLKDAGKLAEAEAMLREALAINQKVLGDEHPQVGLSLSRLGTVLEAQGKLAEAEITYRNAVTIQRKALGKQPMVPAPPMAPQVELGWTLSCLASVLVRQGRLAEAETFQREAVAMVREVLGEGHIDLVALVRRLGDVLAAQGKLAEAEPLYREALAARKKLLGGEHGDVAKALASLVTVLRAQGKLSEAEAVCRDLAERGDAQALNSLAWEMATSADPNVREGQWAVGFAERAVAVTGRTNASYLDTLAAALAETGDFSKAVRVQQEAIALLKHEGEKQDYASRLRFYESGIPYRDSASLAKKTSALLADGKFAEAEPPARECLAIREKLIPDDWVTFNARSMLGGSLLGQKKFAEAEPLLLSGYQGMKQREGQIPPVGKPRLKETLQRLVQLYEATGRLDQAAEWQQKLAEFEQAQTAKQPAPPPR